MPVSAYPGALDTTSTLPTNIAGSQTQDGPAGADHASQHDVENSAIINIETTIGTTAGTSVLQGFAAGNFAARINATGATGTLQQTVVGTLNNATIGTPAITGGTATSIKITDSNSNLSAKSLINSGGSVDISASGAPSAGQVPVASSATAATWSSIAKSFDSQTAINSTFGSAWTDIASFTGTLTNTSQVLIAGYMDAFLGSGTATSYQTRILNATSASQLSASTFEYIENTSSNRRPANSNYAGQISSGSVTIKLQAICSTNQNVNTGNVEVSMIAIPG